MKKVVYFNQWFSSIANVIEDLKNRNDKLIYVIGSSKNSEHAYKDYVDEFIVEDWTELENDINATKKNYVDYVLNICKLYRVDIFFVKKHADWIAERAQEFAMGGTFLINEYTNVFELMQSKSAVYDLLKENNDIKKYIPNYLKTSNKDEIYELLKEIDYDNPWCFKLDNDEGGASFRRIDKSKITLESLHRFRVNTVSLQEAKNMLAYTEPNDLDKIIYMELLDNPEISVDCYKSKKGFIAICREKIAGTRTQRIYYNKEISNLCEKIGKELKLIFPFNVQFRIKYNMNNSIDNIRLLEVNPRMSGGTYYSTLFGMNIAHVCLNDMINYTDNYNIEDYINFDDKYVTYVEKALAVGK